jgi:glyoxylase-like metal-dependent hydrolase (beta-lactamase superfamily II)
LAAASPATASTQAGPKKVPPPSLEKIADDVWIHKSWYDVPGYGPILSQGMVVKTPAGILLIDTAWTDDDTKTLIELIRQEAGAAPVAAIATHAHNDKMGGMVAANAAMNTAAFELTNADAVPRGLTPALNSIDIAQIDKPLGLQQRSPDGTVIARGEVELFYPGPGHTRDNIVVYYAPAKILFGGCLIRPENAKDLGNAADADIGHWAEAARAVAERFPDAKIVIPSHGKKGGRKLLEHTIELAEKANAD